MANKRPSKIFFCRFKDPFVKELATWDPGQKTLAEHCISTLNTPLFGPNGEIGDEFWFLNARIKGETQIIVLSAKSNYPINDPEILAKLETYLEGAEDVGAFQKRGIKKEIEPEIRIETTEIILNVKNAPMAYRLIKELKAKFPNKLEVINGTQSTGHYIKITSLQLSSKEIYDYLNIIKKSKPG